MMKRSKKIRNLDALEKEIYRLRLEAKIMVHKLDDNFDHLRHNFSSMLANSVCRKEDRKENGSDRFFGSGFKNEKINSFADRIASHITDYAAKGVDKLIDRLFQKRK